MRKLPKPTDAANAEYVARSVFELCVSDTTNAALKKRYLAAAPEVEQASLHYGAAAPNTELHLIALNQPAGDLSTKEMIGVYTYRMRDKRRPGRPVYDRIISAPKQQRCPLCGVGVASTLDHHLPKDKFPVLAVTPTNLVPSCRDCQDAKKSYHALTQEGHTLHPYFDDYDNVQWLAAKVLETAPTVFVFFVNAPASSSALERARFNTHMNVFKLMKLYSSNAASEMVGAQGQLYRLLVSGGEASVREHCLDVAQSWANESLNSWMYAMYSAAAASSWFCRGGFMAGNTPKSSIV
jgi:hypothetical protein